MEEPIMIANCNDVKKSLIAIGQELINRADDISRDNNRVTSIIIHAELNQAEIVNFDITKNYVAYLEEEKQEITE